MLITEHEWSKLKGLSDKSELKEQGSVSPYGKKHRATVTYRKEQLYLGLYEAEKHGWMAVKQAKKILKSRGRVQSLKDEVVQFVKQHAGKVA